MQVMSIKIITHSDYFINVLEMKATFQKLALYFSEKTTCYAIINQNLVVFFSKMVLIYIKKSKPINLFFQT